MKKNWIFWIAIAFLVVGIFLCGYFLFLGFSKGMFSGSFVIENLKNNIGSFVSGTVGVLFTITATLFLFITFNEQRKQFNLSGLAQEQSRFETTYFNLLSMLGDVRDNVNKNIVRGLSKHNVSTISDYCELMRNYYKTYPEQEHKNRFNTIMDNLSGESAYTEKNMAEGCISDFFDSFVREYNFSVGYFFRYIYNVINFVVTERSGAQGKSGYNDVQRYLNILQAQLSNEELALIFYDALSTFGENKQGKKQFYILLDEYQFLENIDERFLLHRNHHIFYSKTLFKFLNRDERSLKKKFLERNTLIG